MAIARFENITVNRVVNSTDNLGQNITTLTNWFQTRAKVMDVRDAMQEAKDDRVYTRNVKFVLNYTPNTQTISNNQFGYAINWRNSDWRISDVMESNDRMNVTFTCYRNDPVTSL